MRKVMQPLAGLADWEATIGFARALAMNPRLMLLDEPLEGLERTLIAVLLLTNSLSRLNEDATWSPF